MNDLSWILADKVWLDLLDRRGDGFRAALNDGFAKPDDPGVGVNLEEQPPGLNEKSFQFGDLQRVLGLDRGILLLSGGDRSQPDCPRSKRFTSVHGESPKFEVDP